MNTCFVIVSVIVLAGSALGKTREIQQTQTLRLHVYNDAQVNPRTLQLAAVEVDRLLHAARIQPKWTQPDPEPPEDRGMDLSTQEPSGGSERPYVVVRLLRRTAPSSLPHALGFSLPHARRGTQVWIFYDRVEKLSESVHAPLYIVLGHSIAHEIGHMLLGSSEHSSAGLMQAVLTRKSWQLAAMGLLSFSADEARRINETALRFDPAVLSAYSER